MKKYQIKKKNKVIGCVLTREKEKVDINIIEIQNIFIQFIKNNYFSILIILI